MREILFRGKRVDNGEWIEGSYIKANYHWHNHGIHEDWIATNTIQNGGWCNVRIKYAVVPETVGQYTGLTDKNDKKIFEGDVVNCYGDIRTVVYDTEYAEFKFNKHDNVGNPDSLELCCDCDECEVVGNKYDYYEV